MMTPLALRLFSTRRCRYRNGRRAFLRFVESLRPLASTFSMTGGSARPSSDLTGKRLHTNCIHDLEWAEFPGEAPAQRAINIHDVVEIPARGGLRTNTFRKARPTKLLGLSPFCLPSRARPARAGAPACPRLPCPFRREANLAFCRARYSIVFTSRVRISLSPSPFTFCKNPGGLVTSQPRLAISCTRAGTLYISRDSSLGAVS